jgi:hypothetical protein
VKAQVKPSVIFFPQTAAELAFPGADADGVGADRPERGTVREQPDVAQQNPRSRPLTLSSIGMWWLSPTCGGCELTTKTTWNRSTDDHVASVAGRLGDDGPMASLARDRMGNELGFNVANRLSGVRQDVVRLWRTPSLRNYRK